MEEVHNLTTAKIQEEIFFNPHLYKVSFSQEIIYGYVLPVVAFISLIANILILVTLSNRKDEFGVKLPKLSSLDMILQHLAIYDIAVALLSVMVYVIPTVLSITGSGQEYLNHWHPQMLPFMYPLLHMAITGKK